MVKLFMDFDSTITEESTLMQLYLRLPKSVFQETVRISNQEYYANESSLTEICYSNLKRIIKDSTKWNECLTRMTAEIMQYSSDTEGIEFKGMNLIEKCLKELNITGLSRAASQITTRHGFTDFVRGFDMKSRYIISFNWSQQLISLLCPDIPFSNIISNRLVFRGEKCIGSARNRTLLTPEDKFRNFTRLKDEKNIFCGDSLPDLLPSVYSDTAFAFVSHDKEFLIICNMLNEKFSRPIYIINNFNEASIILRDIKLF